MRVVIWAFRVRPDRVAAFERAYGPAGAWVQLFETDPDYHGTELLRDLTAPDRYLTIDRWRSGTAPAAFREREAVRYAALDAECASLTVHEELVGEYQTADRPALRVARGEQGGDGVGGTPRDPHTLDATRLPAHDRYRPASHPKPLGQEPDQLLVGRPIHRGCPEPDLHGVAMLPDDLGAGRPRLHAHEQCRDRDLPRCYGLTSRSTARPPNRPPADPPVNSHMPPRSHPAGVESPPAASTRRAALPRRVESCAGCRSAGWRRAG